MDHEMSRLPLGNQHTDDLSIMEWQCVKAAAIAHDVENWTSLVDTQLTYEENCALMSKRGSATGATMKDVEWLSR
jgi:hypothetical protein